MFFFVLMIVSGVYAVVNQDLGEVLSTSTVDIAVDTYNLNSANEAVEHPDSQAVMPGNVLTFIPKIFNKGIDCYLRVKVNYINDDIDFKDYVSDFSSDFTKYGDYYYYDDVFSSGAVIDLFKQLKIPNNAEDLAVNNSLRIEIIAEAIQAKNFEPDYNQLEPWGNVEPTKNIRNIQDIVVDDESNLVIKYENDTDDDITVSDGFLDNTKKVVPGDRFAENIDIENKSNDKAKYYMDVIVNNDEDTVKLLSQIDVIIKDGGQELFNGKMIDIKKVLLADLSKGGKANIQFDVYVPIELANEYTIMVPDFTIIFSAEYENGSSNPITDLIMNPKTGDRVDIMFLIFLLSSCGLVFTMILAYRERKKTK